MDKQQHTQIKVQKLSDLEHYNLGAFPINGHMILKEFPSREDLEKCNIDPKQFVETFKYRSVYGLAAGVTIIHVIEENDIVVILGDHILHKEPWFSVKLLYDTGNIASKQLVEKLQSIEKLQMTKFEEGKETVMTLDKSDIAVLLERLSNYDGEDNFDDFNDDEEPPIKRKAKILKKKPASELEDDEDEEWDDEDCEYEEDDCEKMSPEDREKAKEQRNKEWLEQHERGIAASIEKRRRNKEVFAKRNEQISECCELINTMTYEEKFAVIAAGVKKGMDELRTRICEMRFAKNMAYEDIAEALAISAPRAQGICVRFEGLLRGHVWKKITEK